MASKRNVYRTVDLQRAVKKGAAFLDRVSPGWFRRVDGGALKMDNCYQCVLGQLFGEFWSARRLLTPPGYGVTCGGSRWDIDHGFNVRAGGVWNQSVERYARLLAEWRRVIAERRA